MMARPRLSLYFAFALWPIEVAAGGRIEATGRVRLSLRADDIGAHRRQWLGTGAPASPPSASTMEATSFESRPYRWTMFQPSTRPTGTRSRSHFSSRETDTRHLHDDCRWHDLTQFAASPIHAEFSDCGEAHPLIEGMAGGIMQVYQKLAVKDGWVNGFIHHPGFHGGPLPTSAVMGLISHTMVEPPGYRRFVHAGTAWQRQLGALRHRAGRHRHSVGAARRDGRARDCCERSLVCGRER